MIQYLEQLFGALIPAHQIPVGGDPGRQYLDPQPLAQANILDKGLTTCRLRQIGFEGIIL